MLPQLTLEVLQLRGINLVPLLVNLTESKTDYLWQEIRLLLSLSESRAFSKNENNALDAALWQPVTHFVTHPPLYNLIYSAAQIRLNWNVHCVRHCARGAATLLRETAGQRANRTYYTEKCIVENDSGMGSPLRSVGGSNLISGWLKWGRRGQFHSRGGNTTNWINGQFVLSFDQKHCQGSPAINYYDCFFLIHLWAKSRGLQGSVSPYKNIIRDVTRGESSFIRFLLLRQTRPSSTLPISKSQFSNL